MSRIRLIEIRGAYRYVMDIQASERKLLLSEIVQVKGLMPLLMKPRNKQKWSAEDRAELREHMQRLSHISPYIAVMIMPGSFLLLPILAWWLDRRRRGAPEQRNKFATPPDQPPSLQASAQSPAQPEAQSPAQAPAQQSH